MQPFTSHSGLAAAMLQDNINTDLIIPKQFLKIIHRRGLGQHLFHDLRGASILLAGANFGCGSSREHAPWALLDFGFRVVLAPSFADIFATNAVKNGILTGVLGSAELAALAAHQGALEVDLESQRVRAGAAEFPFRTDPWARGILLEGLDEIEQTLRGIARVEAFERARRETAPWL